MRNEICVLGVEDLAVARRGIALNCSLSLVLNKFSSQRNSTAGAIFCQLGHLVRLMASGRHRHRFWPKLSKDWPSMT